MIDSHCHLNASYDAVTVEPVVNRFIGLSGKRIVDVTTTIDELKISQEIIARFPAIVYGNVGIHPESPNGDSPTFLSLMENTKTLAEMVPSLKNVVGIGETGLDYSHKAEHGDNMHKVIEQQRELFNEHLKMATANDLPLVIHARGEDYADFTAYKEILTILQNEKFSKQVYFHSFGGDYELAKRITYLGYYLGVNGIATYSGAKIIADVVEKVPFEFLLLETDSPFLIPSNMDRSLLGVPKINEPIGIFSTAKRVAALKRCRENDVLEACTQSAKTFFARML